MKNKLGKVDILGTGVSRYNLSQTLEEFKSVVDTDEKIRVSVTPVNCVLWARENKKLRDIYNTADITTADGVPLVWASKALGDPIQGRVTGLDLLPEFAKIAAEKDYSFYFLGAADGVAEKLKERLESEYDGLKVVGTYSPPYKEQFGEEDNQEMIRRINQVKPDVLWVSLSAPKQDYWIYENFEKLDVNIAIGVGAAFDVVAGNISRSPKWMQQAGLEWFYRLLKEPKRLFRRYLIEAPKFIPLVFLQVLKKRFTTND